MRKKYNIFTDAMIIKLKLKRKFWIGLVLLIIFNVSICVFVYNNFDYNQQASVSINVGEKRIVNFTGEEREDYYGFDVTIRYESDGGPFTFGRDIYPYEIELQIWSFPPFEIKNSSLEFQCRLFIPGVFESTDFNQNSVNTTLINFHNYMSPYETIILNPDKFNGTFKVKRSGIANIGFQGELKFEGYNEDEILWFDLHQEELSSTNEIEILHIKEYHSYQQIRFTAVAVIFAAITFSLPATYKTLRDIYHRGY